MLLASVASIPTITGAIEEEYAISEANSGHCDGYVTDHTDLASDIDESEYRRELLNDKWRLLFDKVRHNFHNESIRYFNKLLYTKMCVQFQYDPEGFGEIPVEDFLKALRSPDWLAEIPVNKRDILLLRARESRVEAITFQDFVNVGSRLCNWNSSSIGQRNNQLIGACVR
ncbi:hypothetical protein TSAR_004943, partial [Trichomalopsis sarcophagae]